MELGGTLLAVRLARKIRDSLQMELEAVRYFTDSTAVLGMILRVSDLPGVRRHEGERDQN
jgi:hypothetical protein